jgi:hypothetical protein
MGWIVEERVKEMVNKDEGGVTKRESRERQIGMGRWRKESGYLERVRPNWASPHRRNAFMAMVLTPSVIWLQKRRALLPSWQASPLIGPSSWSPHHSSWS